MASAPRSTSICARATVFLPGHPPQLINPTNSYGPSAGAASLPARTTLKQAVPGHISSVCWQRMIPIFMKIRLKGSANLAVSSLKRQQR